MEKETIQIHTEYIRLDQLLKFTGVAETGGMAKEIILSGCIYVNDEVCTMRGKKIYPGTTVNIDNQVLLTVEAE